MAIAIVGTPQSANAGGGAFPTSLAVNMPAGIVSGNVIYVFCVISSSSSPSPSCAAKPFATVGTTAQTNNGWWGVVLRRVSDGTEGSSLTFAYGGAGGGFEFLQSRAYSGENQSTPEDGGGNSTAVGTTGTSATVTGITTQNANDEIVYFAWEASRAITFGTPTGFGNAATNTDSGNTASLGGWDKAQAAAGATGSVGATGMTSGDVWGAFLFAIQPAAAAGVPDAPVRPLTAAIVGNQSWWVAPAHIHQHNVVFRAANLPDPYRQSMPPIPAIQQGMRQWWAPVVTARTTPGALPAPVAADQPAYILPIQAIQQAWQAPIPALHPTAGDFRAAATNVDAQPTGFTFQAVQQAWWAPVPALHPTITEFHGATENDARPSQLPIQAIQQSWWAPVPALHPTITEFHGATDQDWHPVGFPFQALGQPWWAPTYALHPTITELHGATDRDYHPTGFPLPAIQQGWQLQYVRIPPYGPNNIAVLAIAINTPTGFPRAAIQGTGQFAPVAGMSGFLSGPAPVVSGDPIVVWRHRAGMQ